MIASCTFFSFRQVYFPLRIDDRETADSLSSNFVGNVGSQKLICRSPFNHGWKVGSSQVSQKKLQNTVSYLKDENLEDGPCLVTEQEWVIWRGCSVTATVESCVTRVYVKITVPIEGMALHWAVNHWTEPHRSLWPKDTIRIDGSAVQTPFQKTPDGFYEVNLEMMASMSPDKLVFVLKDSFNNWYNNGGSFSILLKHPTLQDFMDKVVQSESRNQKWSLFNRFCLATELLDTAESDSPEGMAFLFTWLRMSSNKQLAWHGKNDYSPKDMNQVQNSLMTSLAYKVKWSQDKLVRRLARMTMARLPRGGGDADQALAGLLQIMAEKGLDTGPSLKGTTDKFLLQWHHKLRNHTTPDDVHICEAYIRFLETNSMEEFDHVLWEHGRISRDFLARSSRPITAQPQFYPDLIPALQHYLWVLKTVHSGPDLDVNLEMCRNCLGDPLLADLYDILANREAWWVAGRIVECRKELSALCRAESASKDILLLDIAMDLQFRAYVDRVDKSVLSGDDLCEMISLSLHNGCLTEESEHLEYCRDLWDKVKNQSRWSADWSLLALSAYDSILMALQGHQNEVTELIESHSEMLGRSCSIPEHQIADFAREVVESQPLFALNSLISSIEPMLQAAAGLGKWQVFSHGSAKGRLLFRRSMAEIRSQDLLSPAIVLTEQICGSENIPEGVVAILGNSANGVLSQLAAQARNAHVLMAGCMDPLEMERMRAMDGHVVQASVDPSGDVLVTFLQERGAAPSHKRTYVADKRGSPVKPALQRVSSSREWVVEQSSASADCLGYKSQALRRLRHALPSSIQVAESLALPFDTFDRVLQHPANQSAAADFWASVDRLKHSDLRLSDASRELQSIRRCVSGTLLPPPALKSALSAAAEAAGLIPPGKWEHAQSWDATWQALCSVWACKWTDQAWLSRRARAVSEDGLRMAAILQQAVPAQYAFLLHTAHPVSRDHSTLLAEVVSGMSQSLVGQYPGRPLTFTFQKSSPFGSARVKSLPSKSVGFFSPHSCLIARSDPSAHFLEGSSSASMGDSVFIEPPREIALDYSQDPILWDSQFRADVLRDIALTGLQIEASLGGMPQDIEGLYSHGRITVLQSKPQMF